MSIDFNRAYGLLLILKESQGYPRYKWLLDAAAAELDSLEPKPKVLESRVKEVEDFKAEMKRLEPKSERRI